MWKFSPKHIFLKSMHMQTAGETQLNAESKQNENYNNNKAYG